jgi:N-acetylneuraminic acid mutarotase
MVALGVLLVIAVALTVWLSSPSRTAPRRSASAQTARGSGRARPAKPARLAVSRLPVELPVALQDSAAAYLGAGRVVLLGGLNAADTSTDAVRVLEERGVSAGESLPEPQHDAQAALLGSRVYVFGGGQFASYNHILSYDPATGAVSVAGELPAPTSDAAVGVLGGTAYVVGGFDGQQALDTVVAWRPGEPARVVGHLSYGLRYAAVAASDGRLVIAGGSREGTTASNAILGFEPASGRVSRLGQLPAPVTHAAAVTSGSYVYVLGGRGEPPGTQTAAILAIAPSDGHAVQVGALPEPLSDAAVVALGGSAWLVGGLGADGRPLSSVFKLTPVRP